MGQRTEPKPLRSSGRLSNGADWERLTGGDVDAVVLEEFATSAECDELRTFIRSHPRAVSYSTAAGVTRLGNSFSDIRKAGRLAEEYSRPDILVELMQVNGVLARLLRQITDSWTPGVETLSYQGVVLHRAVARRIVGGSVEPHDDNIAKELRGDATAAGVLTQLGVNLYVEAPESGGELEGWRRRLSSEEYDGIRNPDPKLNYGVLRGRIGVPDWILKPSKGAVIIFRNSELHAIRASEGGRSTCGFFLGYRGPAQSLLMWS